MTTPLITEQPDEDEPQGRSIRVGFGAFVFTWLFLALFFFLVWNVGIVALVAACGGTVGKLGYIACLFVVPVLLWFTNLVRR